MSLTILRWKGGYAGDMTLRLIMDSYPTAKTNVKFKEINEVGSIPMDISHLSTTAATELDMIGLDLNDYPQFDEKKLEKELDQLVADTDVWYIKNHCYGVEKFNKYTIDIIADELSLPFVAVACLKKCNPQAVDSKLLKIITDQSVAEKYAMYNIIKDTQIKHDISDRQILVSSIIFNFDIFKQSLAQHGIVLTDSSENFYQQWHLLNKDYLPSQKYIEYINTKNYNFDDLTLTFYERYSLLVLANKKFIVLN